VYREGETGTWQTSPIFDELTPNTSYKFYAQITATITHEASAVSTASEPITTYKANLVGDVTITGNAVFGETLSANTSGLATNVAGYTDFGTLGYQWRRGDEDITGATGYDYTLTADDVNQNITVRVTSANCLGNVVSTAVTVAKAAQLAPSAPTLSSKTATSITLETIAGAEYSKDGETWQDSPTFAGLTPNTSYTFYAQIKGDATHETSPASPASESVTTDKANLVGDVTITGDAVFGETLSANTSGLATDVAGYADFGTLGYQWQRNNVDITGATASAYTITEADVEQNITVRVTSSNCLGNVVSTAVTVAKATPATPAAPTLSSKTSTSITLETIAGAEYSKDGETWQDSPTFTGLTPNTSYTFFARIKGDATHDASPASPASESVTTDKANLVGDVTITGDAIFGETLNANTSGLATDVAGYADFGTLGYQWQRNNEDITGATASAYTITEADVEQNITVRVTSANCLGSVVSTAVTVAKATQTAPSAPTLSSKTATSITLNEIAGAEYSKDGETWQDSPTFTGLTPNTSYTFYARIKGDATHETSPASDGFTVKTYDTQAELISLSVNGIPVVVEDTMTYIAKCGEQSASFDITVSPTVVMTVVANGTTLANLSNIQFTKDMKVTVRIVSEDGKHEKIYVLLLYSTLKADNVLFQRWDDVLAVNSNPVNNGNYTNIDSVRWYHNDDEYSFSKEWYIKLTDRVENYRAEISIDGIWHNVCGSPEVRTLERVIAYPNPVSVGDNLNLHLPAHFAGGYMNVVTLSGSIVKHKLPLPNTNNVINVSDWSSGVYLLNIVSPNGNVKTVKIIVN
jgi:hypothetical protein